MDEYRFLTEYRVVSGLHVGGGGSAFTDSDVRRDPSGRLVIPGTTIAGVLRSAVERLSGEGPNCLFTKEPQPPRKPSKICDCRVCDLFGNVRPIAGAKRSRVTVLDALLDDGAETRIVDSVAIDRARGAAADAKKFDYAEVRKGASLRIDVRVTQPNDDERQWIESALRLIGEGKLMLGGLSAKGEGLLEATSNSIRRRNLEDVDHLIATLTHGSDDPAAWPVACADGMANSSTGTSLSDEVALEFTLATAPGSSFLVADPVEAIRSRFDMAPRGGADSAELVPASLRGALRAGAERIVRTLGGKACDVTQDPCSGKAATPQGKGASPEASPAKAPKSRCMTCHLFGNEKWGSRLTVQVRGEPLSAGRGVPFDHVALDRFTGGARDTAKFDVLSSTGGRHRVRLVLGGVEAAEEPWMLGLLALTLQDLAEGWITVGYGGAKGNGVLQVEGAPVWSRHGGDLGACVSALWKEVSAREVSTP